MLTEPGKTASWPRLMGALARDPQILRAGPGIGLFLLRYIRKFQVRDIAGNLVLHSHLPPLGSPAYRRFINEHLIGRVEGPSHAQIGLTAECPHACAYCYNRSRKGEVMDTDQILKVVAGLQRTGVFWLGFTGGEPLLNPDLERITEAAAEKCAVKLFTTGQGLTRDRADSLKQAGLFSASVSLDDPDPAVHDHIRRFPGAHADALRAVEHFRSAGIHVGVSAVLSGNRLEEEKAAGFLEYLEGLGIDEAWLSETKPNPCFDQTDEIMSEEQRLRLVALQDRWNRRGAMTVNYLGHFEGREHFGCNAGIKMIYVDAFGEVSPCVFTPMSFGNIRRAPLDEIIGSMRKRFAHGSECFLNRNHERLRFFSKGRGILNPAQSSAVMEKIHFGPSGKFFQILNKSSRRSGERHVDT